MADVTLGRYLGSKDLTLSTFKIICVMLAANHVVSHDTLVTHHHVLSIDHVQPPNTYATNLIVPRESRPKIRHPE